MTKLGDNIRKLRIENKLTQEQLAKKIGKTKNVISNWERGDNRPDADTIELICGILGVSPNELLSWEKEPVSQTPTTIAAHLPEGVELTDEEQDQLDDYIQFILSRRSK